MLPGVDVRIEHLSQRLAGDPVTLELWRELVRKHLGFFWSPISEEIREEGRTQARAEDILLVLKQRGIDVPGEAGERISNCGDPEIQRRWLRRAVTAASAEEIFVDE